MANVEIAKSTPIINPTPTPTPTPMPETPAPTPEPTPPAPASQSRIEIINPSSVHGLGRNYKANDYKLNSDGSLAVGSTSPTDDNSINLGAVVYNDDGSVSKTAVVTITATDTRQNKTLNGTGDVTKLYVNGSPISVHYYGFYYEFRTTGHHTITFTANGLTQNVELDVQ